MEIKYICEECKMVFDKPKEISAETFYGVSSEFDFSYGNKVSVCPYCEGAYREYEEENLEEKGE